MAAATMADVRARAAQALAPASDQDPEVYDNVVDAVEPPALILTWADPWLTYQTACLYWAQLAVVCVAGRVQPDPGVAKLEELVEYTIGRLRGQGWPQPSTQAPRRFDVANITYLGARVVYRVPVTINGAAQAPPPPPDEPAPVLTSLQPDSAGDWNVEVRALGGNFTAASQIVSGAAAVQPTFVSASELRFVVPGVVAAGVYQVVVRTGSQESAALPFTAL